MATPSFGEKLKQERERRNTSIEEIADKTKIALRFLQALEKDEFDELPGRAFGKFYIRAYAEVLKFDPESLIVDYDKEQTTADGVSAEADPPEPPRPRRVEAEIARWREARMAGQQAPTEAGEEPEPAEVTQQEPPPDESMADEAEPVTAPASDREEEAGGARYDEAAALASILGAQEPASGAWRHRRNIIAVVSCVGLVAILTWIFVSLSGSGDGPVDTESGNGDVVVDESPPVSVEQPAARTTDEPLTPAPAPAAESTADSRADSTGITVSEFGVGRRIVNRRLEGRGGSFEEGSVVWFQTRVAGGAPGESIRHVWLREGSVVQTVDLDLGGTHWRTHSRKTLWGTGDWTVEARDRDGRVLARASFVCVP